MAHLPNCPVPVCQCGRRHELLLQLYIPELPAAARALFPAAASSGLAVFTYCTECMESNFLCPYCVYTEAELDSLVFEPPVEGAKIEAKTIGAWREFECFDCTTDAAYAAVKTAGLSDIEMEEFARNWKRTLGIYLLGNPWYEQGEYDAGEGFALLASFAEDANFSMMWGDDGVAHLWMKVTDGAIEACKLTWMCG
jgi:hypothetical protein